MHAIKKTMKVYKPSSATRDTEFDKLYNDFRDLAKHCASLQQQFKNSRTSWGSVFSNAKATLEVVDRAFANDEQSQAREFATRGVTLLTEWDQQNKDYRETSTETRFKEAEEQLAKYTLFVKSLAKQVDRRNDACTDLDYYRGKVEELTAKGAKNEKEEQRRERAIGEETRKRAEFEQINNEVKIQLAKAVEQKDQIFMRCAVAFMDVNSRIMSQNPFHEMLQGYDGVLQGEWNAVDDYHPEFTPTYTAPAAHGASSTPAYSQSSMPIAAAGAGGAGGAGRNVRALYDFVAENPEEVSFKAGQLIVLNEVLDENWMHGTVNGKDGIFPCNYVEYV